MQSTQRATLITAGVFTIWCLFLWVILWAHRRLPHCKTGDVGDGREWDLSLHQLHFSCLASGRQMCIQTVKDRIIWFTTLMVIGAGNPLLVDVCCATTNNQRLAAPNAPRLKPADAPGAPERKQRG